MQCQLTGFVTWESVVYQLFVVYEQDAGVGFEIDPLGLLDDLQTFYCDIFLISEAEAN